MIFDIELPRFEQSFAQLNVPKKNKKKSYYKKAHTKKKSDFEKQKKKGMFYKKNDINKNSKDWVWYFVKVKSHGGTNHYLSQNRTDKTPVGITFLLFDRFQKYLWWIEGMRRAFQKWVEHAIYALVQALGHFFENVFFILFFIFLSNFRQNYQIWGKSMQECYSGYEGSLLAF